MPVILNTPYFEQPLVIIFLSEYILAVLFRFAIFGCSGLAGRRKLLLVSQYIICVSNFFDYILNTIVFAVTNLKKLIGHLLPRFIIFTCEQETSLITDFPASPNS